MLKLIVFSTHAQTNCFLYSCLRQAGMIGFITRKQIAPSQMTKHTHVLSYANHFIFRTDACLTQTLTHTHTYIDEHIHTYTHIHIYMNTYTYTHTYIHAHIHIHMVVRSKHAVCVHVKKNTRGGCRNLASNYANMYTSMHSCQQVC